MCEGCVRGVCSWWVEMGCTERDVRNRLGRLANEVIILSLVPTYRQLCVATQMLSRKRPVIID